MASARHATSLSITGGSQDSDNRPDICGFYSRAASKSDLDVAMAYPWSADVFPQIAESDGVAVDVMRTSKSQSTRIKLLLPAGLQLNVITLVFVDEGKQLKNTLHSYLKIKR